jgi:hypothetical protein
MTDHLCAAQNRCRGWYLNDGIRAPAIIEDSHGLCRRCYTSVKHAVAALDTDWQRLSTAIGERAQTGQQFVTGTRELPMPLNGTVIALRSSLSEWAEAAMWMIAEALGIDVKIRHKAKGWPVHDRPVIEQAAAALPENLKLLLQAPEQSVSVWSKNGFGWITSELDGIAVALKLADLHHEVNSVLGETNPRTRLCMPCPHCGAKATLGVDNGQTDVTCTACGGQWNQRQYDWLAKLLITEHDEKETEMLKWCLAEANWKLARAECQLGQVRRICRLTELDMAGIDGFAVIELLRETIQEKTLV